jgi:hypothetical protein
MILKWGLALGLVATVAWDVWLHRNALLAQSSRAPYDRSKYFTKTARAPFVFASRYTVTDDSLGHNIRSESTEAVDSTGRQYRATEVFNPSTDVKPINASADLVDSTGNVTGFSRSKWEEDAGAPLLVVFGQSQRVIHEHKLPENNCTAPEPSLKFLRYESLRIGGADYPTAVIQNNQENSFAVTLWLSMTPGLGCLELKSIANYITQEKVKGSTLHEPISLTVGEPDRRLTDIASRIASKQVQMVSIENWEATVKSTVKKYQAGATSNP